MTRLAPSLPAPELAALLRQGQAAIFPTDTLPALATCPAQSPLLWELKQRPAHKPVILMAATETELWQALGVDPLPAWQALARRHWPGALTLVLPAHSSLARQLNPDGDSLGVRIPACSAALELLHWSGPLATTSANPSGATPCMTAAEAKACFPRVARLAPEPWPDASGQASTVLRWHDEGWTLLRAGAVGPPQG
jgi:L-threonylcarbamoyladenylate synthase